MSVSSSLITTSVISGLSAVFVFWIVCRLMLYRINTSWDASLPDIKQRSIQYHNEAIYKDFTFFIKVTLVLMGGVAYLLINPPKSHESMKQLLVFAALFQFVIGILFAILILFHQKSKIERWERKPKLLEPLLWEECWIVMSMIVISSNLSLVIIPGFVLG